MKKIVSLFFICLFIFPSYSNTSTQRTKEKKGILIVGAGISGCGKSSIFKELHKILGGKLFLEPEEHEIPKEYLERKYCDEFTLSMGYRSVRVPQLIKAKHLRDSGQIVLVDSYYNKIMSYYMPKKSFDWLMPKDSPYYSSYQKVLELDTETLPNADIIVLFDISHDDWKKNLNARGRVSDKDPEFLKSYNTCADIEEAIFKVAKKFGIKVIRFKQEFSSPKQQAEKLRSILKREQIL